MNSSPLTVPIALFVFNRPQHTRRVLEEVRRAAPRRLYVFADAARLDRPEEADRCREVQRIVRREVDWSCELHVFLSETNIGAKRNILRGLAEVFRANERAIILEDDCLPRSEFFRFCAELLERFKDDERIAMISGINPLQDIHFVSASYSFSRFGQTWGWATWRRVWSQFDPEMKAWPPYYEHIRTAKSWEARVFKRMSQVYQATWEGKVDAWDYQWLLSYWLRGSLAIHPSRNLVENIGFGPEATNTHDPGKEGIPALPLSFPLHHPPVRQDRKGDRLFLSRGDRPPFPVRLIRRLWAEYVRLVRRGACLITRS